VVGVLEPRLVAHDVLLDLLEVGQMPGKGCQTRIWGDLRLADELGGALGDQDGIEVVVLGTS
jgi:hypothetical protein